MAGEKITIGEKIGYALGDGAANIAWRGVATFLFIFYTDVFGINPATVGMLLLVTRFTDGITDILMGIVGDRTRSRYGKFRPWILWTALPLGITLSLLFTTPNLSYSGKIIWAYATYITFTLVYTANNIPYGALMAVMTGDNKERTTIGSYRMAGAFAGGMAVQGTLLFLVAHFGNVDPTINITKLEEQKFKVTIAVDRNVENANISTRDGVATFSYYMEPINDTTPGEASSLSVSLQANEKKVFIVKGTKELTTEQISIIDQKRGYSNTIYVMSGLLVLLMLITFFSTRERIQPPVEQKSNLKRELIDLVKNKPWIILLFTGLLFNVYNSVKQGITVIYFTHFLDNQLLAGSYLAGLMLASIGGAIATGFLGKRLGKKKLFILALMVSGATNALLFFCQPGDIAKIFVIGLVSEFAAAIFPTLFFAMLGDAADFSEYKNGHRATGLIYSAGSFATKLGGGIAGAIIGFVLAAFNYDGGNPVAIDAAIPGIKMLMSWIPSTIAFITAILMLFYPLDQSNLDHITKTLKDRREEASNH